MQPLFVDPKRVAPAVASNSEPRVSRLSRSLALRSCTASRVRQSALVAVMREPSQLPSLAAARVIAGLRARGDAVRVIELPAHEFAQLIALGGVAEAGGLRCPADRTAVCVLAIDAQDNVHALYVENQFNPAHLGHGLVPDFTDQAFAQTRWLPIAVSGVLGERRSLAAVLHEVREYARRYALPSLIFVDDALNNEDNTFAALVESIQDHATGVQWTCSVRVGSGESDGLSRRIMRRAALAGLRQITFRAADNRSNARACELEKYAREVGIVTKRAGEAQSLGIVTAAPRTTQELRPFKQALQVNAFARPRTAVPADCTPWKD